MLNKAIYFFCLQLLAMPLLAGSNEPANMQSPSLLCHNQPTSMDKDDCGPSKAQLPVNIKAPETNLHAWLHNPMHSLVEPIVIPTVAWNIISQPLTLEDDAPKIVDLGYISAKILRHRCAKMSAHNSPLDNEERYAVNYDGNQLIYFGFTSRNTLQEAPSLHASLPLKKMGYYLLTSTNNTLSQYQNTLDNLKPCILNHAMIHHKTLVEANHISMKDNHLILDNKS